MGDAKANWNALAKALEVEYPNMVGNAVFLSRGDWIADDREAFLHATALFYGDLQKLSGLCYTMESQVDQVRDAYAHYWQEIAALAAVVVGYVVACQLMKLTPHMRLQAELWLNRLIALTNLVISKKTTILLSFLGRGDQHAGPQRPVHGAAVQRQADRVHRHRLPASRDPDDSPLPVGGSQA